MHVSEPSFSVSKCDTLRVDESHRLVTAFLDQSSVSREVQSIFHQKKSLALSFPSQSKTLYLVDRTSSYANDIQNYLS
jgi:hypothetical protein